VNTRLYKSASLTMNHRRTALPASVETSVPDFQVTVRSISLPICGVQSRGSAYPWKPLTPGHPGTYTRNQISYPLSRVACRDDLSGRSWKRRPTTGVADQRVLPPHNAQTHMSS